MKAKDLIRILNSVEPDAEVRFSLGKAEKQEYRNLCAEAELLQGECLQNMTSTGAEVDLFEGALFLTIILEQDYYDDLDWVKKEFDKNFKVIEE